MTDFLFSVQPIKPLQTDKTIQFEVKAKVNEIKSHHKLSKCNHWVGEKNECQTILFIHTCSLTGELVVVDMYFRELSQYFPMKT